jgi:stress response protein YsnF
VEIERRPTAEQTPEEDRPFDEQTIEVQEMYEEPVVSKVLLQTEEVIVRKRVTERTAVIRDTVRVTDVDVEGDEVEGRGAERGGGEVVLLEAAGSKPEADRQEQGRRTKPRGKE